jgi:hypothetical protein
MPVWEGYSCCRNTIIYFSNEQTWQWSICLNNTYISSLYPSLLVFSGSIWEAACTALRLSNLACCWSEILCHFNQFGRGCDMWHLRPNWTIRTGPMWLVTQRKFSDTLQNNKVQMQCSCFICKFISTMVCLAANAWHCYRCSTGEKNWFCWLFCDIWNQFRQLLGDLWLMKYFGNLGGSVTCDVRIDWNGTVLWIERWFLPKCVWSVFASQCTISPEPRDTYVSRCLDWVLEISSNSDVPLTFY